MARIEYGDETGSDRQRYDKNLVYFLSGEQNISEESVDIDDG
jgi:hypothetical protein